MERKRLLLTHISRITLSLLTAVSFRSFRFCSLNRQSGLEILRTDPSQEYCQSQNLDESHITFYTRIIFNTNSLCHPSSVGLISCVYVCLCLEVWVSGTQTQQSQSEFTFRASQMTKSTLDDQKNFSKVPK